MPDINKQNIFMTAEVATISFFEGVADTCSNTPYNVSLAESLRQKSIDKGTTRERQGPVPLKGPVSSQ